MYVRIFYDQAEEALVVPRTCLFRRADGEWQVMIVRRGVTETVDVEVGLMNDEQAQIISGLESGAAVMTRPSREIRVGARVATTQR